MPFVKEVKCISVHPKTVYLTVIFRSRIRKKPIVRLWICISINVAVEKYGGQVCSSSDFSLDGSYRVFPKRFARRPVLFSKNNYISSNTC